MNLPGNLLSKYVRTRYFRNLGPRFVMNSLSKIVGLFVTVYVARYLGPTQLGYFSFVVSLAGFLVLIFGFGLNGYVQKAIPERIEKQRRSEVRLIVSSSIGTILLSSCLLILASLILGVFVHYFMGRQSAILLFTLAGLYGSVLLLGVFLGNVLMAFHRLDAALPYAVARDLARMILTLLCVRMTSSFIPAIVVYIISFGVYAFFIYRILQRFTPFVPRPRVEVLRESLPYFFYGLAGILLFYVDVFMLSYFWPMQVVGYYRSAYVLVSSILSILPFVAVSLPTLSRAAAAGRLRSVYTKIVLFVMSLSAVLVPVLYVLAPVVFDILYGPGYGPSVDIFRVLIFLIPVYFMYTLSIQALVAVGQEWEQILYPLVAGLLNFTLNYLLIPRYGALGAAFATVGSMLFAALLTTCRLFILIYRSKQRA